MKNNKHKNIVVLEIGESVIKTCQVRVTKKASVVTHCNAREFSQPITPQNLQDLYNQIPIDKRQTVIISVAREFFLMKFLDLPSQNRQELQAMLPFQVEKILPFSLDGALYEFSVVKTRDGFSRIILFLVQKKKISSVQAFTERTKVIPTAVTINSWGLYSWICFQSRFWQDPRPWPYLLINIDKYSGDFLVVNQAGPLFSRSFCYSGQQQLLRELGQAQIIFEKEYGKPEFGKVIVTGNRNETVLKELTWPEAVFISSLKNFHLDTEPASSVQAFSFASLLGLSQQQSPCELDFSPPPLKQRRKALRKKKQYRLLALIAVEIIAIFGLFSFKYLFDRYRYDQFLNSQLQHIKVQANELDALSHRLSVLDRQFQGVTSVSRMLAVVIKAIPDNTQLTLLDFQENGDIVVQGRTDNLSRVFALSSALQQEKFLRDLKVNYAVQVKRHDKLMIEFFLSGKRNQGPQKHRR